MSLKHSLSLTLLLLLTLNSAAQLYINEILASNSMVNADPASGEYSDWLELYNAGNTAINLDGYYLTDNLNEPGKWQITVNASIPARGYLLIWCDDLGSGLHSNFKLSASGEELALFDPSLRLIDSLSFGPQYYIIRPLPRRSRNLEVLHPAESCFGQQRYGLCRTSRQCS